MVFWRYGGCFFGPSIVPPPTPPPPPTVFPHSQGPEVLSKWVGESEKAVRTLFSRAAASAPSVIFIDEIDGMVSARRAAGSAGVGDRVLLQLLQEMDGRSISGPEPKALDLEPSN